MLCFRSSVVFELQTHVCVRHLGDSAEPRTAQSLGHVDERFALPSVRLGVDDQDRLGLLRLIFGERRRSVHRGGHAKPAQVDSVPRSFRHLPCHHRPIAVDEDLGIREARPGEDIRGACLDIVAANPCRAGGRRSQAQQGDTQG